MPRVVISYRRSDSAAIAGRIADQLKTRFGEDSVFMDIDNIPFGVDYRDHIKRELLKSEFLVVLIGPRWLAPDPDGTRRIHNEADPVRVEIETALREQVPVIPVLVENAAMPTVKDLPQSLHGFAFLNAAEVDIGRDFRHHVDRLGQALNSRADRRRSAATVPAEASAETPVATALGAKTVAKAQRGYWPFLLAVPLLGLLAAGVWLWANPAWLSGQPAFPAYKERVTDEIGYLAPATRASLTQRLVDLEAKSGAQVVIALLKDLPEQPSDYARQLSEHWRVGGEHRNGILLALFPDASNLAMDWERRGATAKYTHTETHRRTHAAAPQCQGRRGRPDPGHGRHRRSADRRQQSLGSQSQESPRGVSGRHSLRAASGDLSGPAERRWGRAESPCRALHRLQHCRRHSGRLDGNHHRHLSPARRRQDDAAVVCRKLARLLRLDIELLHRR
jgi:hypothetical protein